MVRVFAWVLAAATAAGLFGLAEAAAQDRFALVIGNSKYRTVTALPNPVRDAEAVNAFLKSAAFDVTMAVDLDQAEMRRAVRDFAAKLADKADNTVMLIYFAGHGVQVDGENYLLPVDAKIEREADVALEAIRFADVMNTLDRIRSKTRLVLLDACRNNPFGDGQAPRGLAIVNAPAGSLVAYSTSPGATAEDGSGSNSPFTVALLAAGKNPGAPIETALKDVRLAVHKVTEGRQVSWEVSALVEPFSFFPGAAAPAPGPTPNRERSAAAWRLELQSRSPEQALEIVVREDNPVVYREFLALFPQAAAAPRLRAIMDRRIEMWDWFDAVSLDLPSGYEAFLKLYPDSDLAVTARRMNERSKLRTAVANASPGALGISAQARPGTPQIQVVTREIRVPSPPEVRTVTVVKEVPVIKEIVKEVPVVRTVTREVPVIKTVTREVPVTKIVQVPTPCRCATPGPVRGPFVRPGPMIRPPMRAPPYGHGSGFGHRR